MANAINDIEIKGKPARTARTKDRDEERGEQEYERRINRVRGEVASHRLYLKDLYDVLIAKGIEVSKPPT